MAKVFLGGTCNNTTWRERLIPMLEIDYFNPVVKDWTPKCQEIERQEKLTSDWQLFVITPQMTGVFSIAEVVDASNKNPKGTIMCVLWENEGEKFTEGQRRSVLATLEMVQTNGAWVAQSLEEVASILNNN